MHSGEMASRCRSEPPSLSRGSKGGPELPKRVTTLEPEPPTPGREWQAAQLSSFMMGPRPSATVNVFSKASFPASKRATCAGVRPGTGSPMRGWISWAAAAARQGEGGGGERDGTSGDHEAHSQNRTSRASDQLNP